MAGATVGVTGADDRQPPSMDSFRRRVLAEGRLHWRDLPWRRTRDPYGVWVSEVMLQQTQVSRVDGRWQRWLARFPDPASLAAAETADVLSEWQGLGYNRRALALQRAASEICGRWGGRVPRDAADLVSLPGIGPATAAGIRAFAFDLPGVYLETNVRAVFLHEFFPDGEKVPDRVLVPLVEELCQPCRLIARARGLDFSLRLPEGYPALAAPGPFRRAVSSILSNAVTYAQAGGLVSVYLEDGALVVECDPIPAGEVRRLFQPFCRPDLSRSRESGGNGLGLYFADSLLTAMGLRYAFGPMEEPPGMRFTIWLE